MKMRIFLKNTSLKANKLSFYTQYQPKTLYTTIFCPILLFKMQNNPNWLEKT